MTNITTKPVRRRAPDNTATIYVDIVTNFFVKDSDYGTPIESRVAVTVERYVDKGDDMTPDHESRWFKVDEDCKMSETVIDRIKEAAELYAKYYELNWD